MKILTSNGKICTRNGNVLGKDYTELCFTAGQANSTVEFLTTDSSFTHYRYTAYSRDRQIWTLFTPSTTAGTNVVTLANVGDKVYFRNNIISNWTSTEKLAALYFSMTGSIYASGNVNSMYSASNFNNITTLGYKGCLTGLFVECSALKQAPILPATTLSENCYALMFAGTSITKAPQLPATNLAAGCYSTMFGGCEYLINPPKLSSEVLANACYSYMFTGCTSLLSVPKLPAQNILNETSNAYYGAYQGMFNGCTSLEISDSSTLTARTPWKLPSQGNVTYATTQTDMFENCLGTRSSDTLTISAGASKIYYVRDIIS